MEPPSSLEPTPPKVQAESSTSSEPPKAQAEPNFLQDVWTYYFHDPDDANWNFESYIRLADVSTIDDFWAMNATTAPFVNRGMFFVMREHVFPCWDDPHNINGGCISMKVLKNDLPSFWQEMVMHMLGERLVVVDSKEEDEDAGDTGAWSDVTGLSVSPKRFFCIVKIWLRYDRSATRKALRIPSRYTGEVLFRSNTDNIRGNSCK
jgi:hypothetical protein